MAFGSSTTSIESIEHGHLGGLGLHDRLDDELAVGKLPVVGREGDTALRRGLLVAGQLAFADRPGKGRLDPLAALGDGRVGDFDDDDVELRPGR